MPTYPPGKSPQTLAALAKARTDPVVRERQQRALLMRHRIHDAIDNRCGPAAVEIVDEIVAIAKGTMRVPSRAPNPGEDPATYATMVPHVHPTIRERLAAAQWIIEYRNGKAYGDPHESRPGHFYGISTGIPESGQQPQIDLSLLTDDELAIQEHILTKLQNAAPPSERTVDAPEFAEFEPVAKEGSK